MKVIIVHVPRTAGTTLNRILRAVGINGTADSKELPNVREALKTRKFSQPYRYSKDKLTKDKLIYGHFPLNKYYPLLKDTHKFVTFVRDPVERVVSHYQWLKYRGPDHGCIADHETRSLLIRDKLSLRAFSMRIPNPSTLLLGDDLSIFDFVGITEHFDDSLLRLSKTFDIELPEEWRNWNVKGIDYKASNLIVSDSDRKKIRNHQHLDYKQYYEALNIHEHEMRKE